MAEAPPHPGVGFPPPFLYAAGFAAGLLLHRLRPLPVAGPEHRSLVETAGLVLMALWLGMMLWAFAAFRRARTTIIPNRPASALVAYGPYRLSRNPMYVSLALGYAGLALLLDRWWPLFLLPLVLAAVDRLVIAREERYLAGAFPAEYAEYRRRVRRWL